MAEDWNARQYLKFEDERTRPPRDLLAQVPLQSPRRVIDLGCGPGNSTELLIARYPQAEIVGVDSSSDMLRQARERLPYCAFAEADLATWIPQENTDLLFANAVFQWVPDHPAVLRRLLERLPDGGVLALQMPDNTDEPALALMREVAKSGPWAAEVGWRPRRATTCRRRRIITIYSSRSAVTSTSGTRSTTTSWPDPTLLWNGSGVPPCARSCPSSMRTCAAVSWLSTARASRAPIPRASTVASCCDSPGCSSSPRDNSICWPRGSAALVYSAARLFALTRTLVAIGPVSPTSSL